MMDDLDLELGLNLTPEDESGLRQSSRMQMAMAFEDYWDFLEEISALKPIRKPGPKSYPEQFRL